MSFPSRMTLGRFGRDHAPAAGRGEAYGVALMEADVFNRHTAAGHEQVQERRLGKFTF